MRPAEHHVANKLQDVVVDSRIVVLGILASRITGFGRIAAASAVLGPTYFGNLFQATSVLPSTLYGLLMGTLISALLVPPLVRRMSGNDPGSVRCLANAAFGLMIAVLLGIGLMCVLVSPVLVRLLTAAVSDPAIREQQIRLGIPLLMMVVPQLALYGVIGAGSAVQQAHHRFGLAASASIVENLVAIGVLASAHFFWGVGTDTQHVSLSQLTYLGLGTTAAVSMHAAIQWFGAYRIGIALVPSFRWCDPAIRQIIRNGAASIGFTGLYWAAYLIAVVVSGAVPGGVVAFQIANSLCYLPAALTSTPLASAQLPRLSASHERQDLEEFNVVFRAGFRVVLFAVVPAALLLAILPRTLAGAVAFGDMGSPTGIALMAACIGGLGIGVIGEATFLVATSAFYARHDSVNPLRAMVLRFAITAAGAITAYFLLPSGPDLMGAIGAVLAVANIAAGGYLHYRISRMLPGRRRDVGLVSAVVISGLATLPAMPLTDWISRSATSVATRLLGAVLVSAVVLSIYLVIQFVRGSQEIRLLLPVTLASRLGGRPVADP